MSLRAILRFGLVLWLGSGIARAEVPPVEVSVAESTAWTGERVPIRIELRASGSFSGSAAFDLPKIPGSLLLKVGNPVVSSKEIEGESWFIQIHEFALFSQKTGTVTIPSFPVRFEAREGFTGEAKPVVAETEPISIEIQRPPGSEGIPFLVTTENLDITESWDPDPGEAAEVKVGDVFRRTIVQRSRGLTGMALVPAPTLAPEGVRVYEPKIETSDNTERGAFEGERRETLTYLLQEPGAVTLPSLVYTWWNPKAESLEEKTLPGIPLEVVAVEIAAPERRSYGWRWLVSVLVAGGLFLFGRKRVVAGFRRVRLIVDPPERAYGRQLLHACRKEDARAANAAWDRWIAVVGSQVELDRDLKKEVSAMRRQVYGRSDDFHWNGKALSKAFKESRVHSLRRQPSLSSALPPLNFPSRITQTQHES